MSDSDALNRVRVINGRNPVDPDGNENGADPAGLSLDALSGGIDPGNDGRNYGDARSRVRALKGR